MSLQSARSLAEKLGTAHARTSLPVRPELIARALGIAYFEEALDNDVDALLIVKDRKSTICVNSSKPATRQRFSAAHELGHHVLGHYGRAGEHVHVDKGALILMRSAKSSAGIDPVEIEANQFAASLLMPSSLIRVEIERLENTKFNEEEKIERLADKFEVSVQAMTIRLTNMKLI